MGIPFEKTEAAKPRPFARFDELEPLLGLLVLRYGERVLLLPEAERVAAVVERVRELLPKERTIEVDATDLDALGFVRRLRAAVLPRYGLEDVERVADAGILLSDLGRRLPHFFKDEGFVTGRERPILLVHGASSDLAVGLFARGRDEMWGLGLATVVVAPKEDKDRYLLTVSDSYFLRNIYWVRD